MKPHLQTTGEEGEVDYGESAPTRVPGTDRYREPRSSLDDMWYSRRCLRRVVWKSIQETWARPHEDVWRYFEGSCRYVVLDNARKASASPDLCEPELNPVYVAMLSRYAVVSDPARVGDPNREGSVAHAAPVWHPGCKLRPRRTSWTDADPTAALAT